MPRRYVVLLLLAASLTGALVTGRDIFFSLTYAWAALLALSFLWAAASLRGVEVSRHTRSRTARVGRPFDERFAIRNLSRIPKLWVEVRDQSELPGHHAGRVVDALRPGAERAWTVRTVCKERGRYRLGPVAVSSGDPFGLFQRRRQLPQINHVVVYPGTVDLPDFVLPLGLLPGGEALRRKTHQVTPNASGIRDYAPGDSFNRIHWRSTARRDQLLVKEFELDPMADVWVFLDACGEVQRGLEAAPVADSEADPLFPRRQGFVLPPTTEEYGVSIAASIAQYFVREGRAVGFVGYGRTRDVVQADRGERQLTKILEVLAVLRARGALRLDEVLQIEGDSLPRGTTVVLVTPSLDRRWVITAQVMQRRGLRPVAVLIDAATFGGAGGAEGLAQLLRADRIPARVVRRGDDLAAALSGGVVEPRRFTDWAADR